MLTRKAERQWWYVAVLLCEEVLLLDTWPTLLKLRLRGCSQTEGLYRV